MRAVFADTFYWVALTNQKDSLNKEAISWKQSHRDHIIVTPDEVFIEFLTFYSSWGSRFRYSAAQYVRKTLQDPDVRAIPQTRESFLTGLDLVARRMRSTFQDRASVEADAHVSPVSGRGARII